MKISLLSVVAAFAAGLPAISAAFTLDAIGYEGGELSRDPLSVHVPGYGELIFETPTGLLCVVESGYENTQHTESAILCFDKDHATQITFNGIKIKESGFDFPGSPSHRRFEVHHLTQPDLFTRRAFWIPLNGNGVSTGVYGTTPTTQSMPEPSSTLLGIIGAASLMLRRKR